MSPKLSTVLAKNMGRTGNNFILMDPHSSVMRICPKRHNTAGLDTSYRKTASSGGFSFVIHETLFVKQNL